MSSLHQGFQQAGSDVATAAVFRWLDRMDGHPSIQLVKQQMLDVRPVREGDQVLDVGCGLGHEVRRLAERAGPQGQVVGIDVNPALVAEARLRGSPAQPVAYAVGDAHHVAFSDNSFDLCRAERVLRYLTSPETALLEMARVTRSGGSVVAFDFDSDQTVVDAPDSALARRIAEVLDAAVPHPWAGRRLFGLFQRAGLRDVRVVPNVMCFSGQAGFAVYQQVNRGTLDRAVQAGEIAPDEVAAWWDGLERAAEAETFFVANLGFIVVGHKP